MLFWLLTRSELPLCYFDCKLQKGLHIEERVVEGKTTLAIVGKSIIIMQNLHMFELIEQANHAQAAYALL